MIKVHTLKLTMEYDGTRLYGFQIQKKHRTVQEDLEKAFSKIFQKPIKVSGAGRTDSGVHALAQTAHVKVPDKMKLNDLQRAINANLSKDIVIKKLEKVKDDFHARYDAKGKVYRYSVWNSRLRTPLQDRTVYHYIMPLNVSKMKAAAKVLIGRHDFKSFQSSGGNKEMSTVRNLTRLSIQKKGALIYFTLEANGFLYNMVRNIVGTLIWVGLEKIDIKELRTILKAKDRKKAGPNVPGKGLCLIRVKY